jgi:hypothetical protein
MKKNLILSLLAVAVCSVAVYAANAGLGDKIKAKTETTSVTVQQKVESVNAVMESTGNVIVNTTVKEKTKKTSVKAKAKTKKIETKVTTTVKKVASVKNGVASSTTTVVAISTTTVTMPAISTTTAMKKVVASTCTTVVK